MSAWIDVRGDVHEVIGITWSSVTAIYSGQMAQRINWKQLIEQYESGDLDENNDPIGLNPPYAAIQWGAEQSLGSKWGICNAAWAIPCDVWYVISTVNPDGSAKSNDEMDDDLSAKATALKLGFLQASGKHFTCEDASYDPSDGTNEANEYFLKFNYPMYSAKISLMLEYRTEITRNTP